MSGWPEVGPSTTACTRTSWSSFNSLDVSMSPQLRADSTSPVGSTGKLCTKSRRASPRLWKGGVHDAPLDSSASEDCSTKRLGRMLCIAWQLSSSSFCLLQPTPGDPHEKKTTMKQAKEAAAQSVALKLQATFRRPSFAKPLIARSEGLIWSLAPAAPSQAGAGAPWPAPTLAPPPPPWASAPPPATADAAAPSDANAHRAPIINRETVCSRSARGARAAAVTAVDADPATAVWGPWRRSAVAPKAPSPPETSRRMRLVRFPAAAALSTAWPVMLSMASDAAPAAPPASMPLSAILWASRRGNTAAPSATASCNSDLGNDESRARHRKICNPAADADAPAMRGRGSDMGARGCRWWLCPSGDMADIDTDNDASGIPNNAKAASAA
mmetsp:Transcript_119964/g.344826  ORF Transcript_119964/g.344826 Transcript_119964/m.344826 type:complete len:385 (+) Transcript_119964:843-1997(+)